MAHAPSYSDPLFQGLARPPMFAGVPAAFFVVLMIGVGEGIFLTKSLLVFVVGACVYLIGLAICVRDPNALHVFALRWRKCPPVLNAWFWRGNAYQP